tara:strand:+ start:2260 stop:2955 length:696 start_codon:yes stop_codon:yes gene_type:complete
MNKILGLILARSGSKRLPNKNIIEIKGKPLIYYSIQAAKRSKFISEIYVSSDSLEILDISKKYNSKVFLRDKKFAEDKTSSEESIREFLLANPNLVKKFSYLCLLQPTSPLRDENDIDDCIKLLDNSKARSVISVCNPNYKFSKYLCLNKDKSIKNQASKFNYDSGFNENYYPNGAVYIFEIDSFLKTNSIIQNTCLPYLMKNLKSIDIDTYDDLAYLKYILSEKYIDNIN